MSVLPYEEEGAVNFDARKPEEGFDEMHLGVIKFMAGRDFGAVRKRKAVFVEKVGFERVAEGGIPRDGFGRSFGVGLPFAWHKDDFRHAAGPVEKGIAIAAKGGKARVNGVRGVGLDGEDAPSIARDKACFGAVDDHPASRAHGRKAACAA